MDTQTEVLCDTILHISEVRQALEIFESLLRQRGLAHDRTKLEAFEFDAFVKTRPEFKKANYGTPEYEACTEAIKPAIDHHYANNRHHTAHRRFVCNGCFTEYDTEPDRCDRCGYSQFQEETGIEAMTLVDLLEMLADWAAASRRSPDVELEDTLDDAFARYGINPQLARIIRNTIRELRRLGGIPEKRP